MGFFTDAYDLFCISLVTKLLGSTYYHVEGSPKPGTAGRLFAMLISVIFEAKFNAPAYEVDPVGSTVPEADYLWRIILMAGAVPAALTYN
ncbi:hypothetical protein ACFX2J_004075 [Malus domestica]